MNNTQALLSALLSGDDRRAEVAARRIASFGTDALPVLQELLASHDPESRWWAIRALAEIKDPQISLLLRPALHDPDLAVRQCAALALRQLPCSQAIPDLIACLGAEDRLLAHLAADALIATGPEAVPPLLETMQHGPQASRLEAVRALALISDHSTIPVLFAALDDESALIEHWANEGLERMGVGMVFFKPGG